MFRRCNVLTKLRRGRNPLALAEAANEFGVACAGSVRIDVAHHTPILKTALHNFSLGSLPNHLMAFLDPTLVRFENTCLRPYLPLSELAVACHRLFQHLDRDLPCLDLASCRLTNEGEIVIERHLDCGPKREPPLDWRKCP